MTVLTDSLAGRSLSARILGTLVGFLIMALVAISTTLYMSWRLEGVAAAINDAGSLRMRIWHIAYRLSSGPPSGAGPLVEQWRASVRGEMERLRAVQAGLERGDPARPLYVPRDQDLPQVVHGLGEYLEGTLLPAANDALEAPSAQARARALVTFEEVAATGVDRVNQAVSRMEASYLGKTNILQTSQALLTALAVIGTVALLRFFFVTVVRPVHSLHEGIRRMQAEDFSARVPVLTNDEFGDLSRGFNQMAGHLEGLYANLEERVEQKTLRLEQTIRELSILYDVSHFLRQAATTDQLSQGFLQRVRATFEAAAASVRLYEADSGNLYLTAQTGLGESFVASEAVLRCSDCVCGAAVGRANLMVGQVRSLVAANPLGHCAEHGFATVVAIPVNFNQRPVGVVNLFFATETELSEGDRQLLENLGEHLAVAIEHLRLRAREREMAVLEERNIIARELHDSIAQGLAFLNIQVQILDGLLRQARRADVDEVLGRIRAGIQEGYATVRELLQHFRARFDNTDLARAIDGALRKFTEQSGIAHDFEVVGAAAPISTELQTQVLYILQEALSNIRKHAQAKRARVTLARDRQALRLVVADDGRGFDPASCGRTGFGEHVGLHIMSERAARIGGLLQIDSQLGAGTVVSFELNTATEKIQ